MRDFRELRVWEKARLLVQGVYVATAKFPLAERFGITSQFRRATISIAANIAEGCGRAGNAELARFLTIAMGSACETECELPLSMDLDLLPAAAFAALNRDVIELKRMLGTLITKVNAARG